MIRRHRLETCSNMRDIGGYCGFSVVKFNEFIRSDDVSFCTDKDIEYIREIGVKTIIDLRGRGEVSEYPNTFAARDGFKYYNVPLMREDVYGDIRKPFDLAAMYMDVLENKTAINKLFTVISDNAEGTILYHCTAGKDRTGLTTCLLLMLAGADKYDIAADYEVSYTYLTLKRIDFNKLYPGTPQHMLESKPEMILRVYDYITEKYGSVFDYLLNAGISKDNLEKIGRKLCTN